MRVGKLEVGMEENEILSHEDAEGHGVEVEDEDKDKLRIVGVKG